MRAAFAPIWQYFGQSAPSDDAVKHFRPRDGIAARYAGFDGKKVVSGSAHYAFRPDGGAGR